MSRLSIHPEGSSNATGPAEPLLESDDPAVIKAELAKRGIAFERWPAKVKLDQNPSESDILAAYAVEIARMQADGRYPTVDAIRITPDHPDREALRQKFLAEHTHAEDEVRFFVEGQGLFSLHIGQDVVQVLCEANDWISGPA
ncbi:MAG: acireductone dioxygenase, partial [Cyanobacteriota bacterium]|nr:acireductone dioxygenase [Cyanobacteriota bacterium]